MGPHCSWSCTRDKNNSGDDDEDQCDNCDHLNLIVHGLGLPLPHPLDNLVRLLRHVRQLQDLGNHESYTIYSFILEAIQDLGHHESFTRYIFNHLSSNDDYEYGVVDNDPRWIYGPAPRSGNIWDYSYHQQK